MQDTRVRSLGREGLRRRDKLLTPVFWPGESHGLCSLWVRKESHTTERLSLSLLPYVCVGLSCRRRVSTGSRLGPWVIISESPASGRPGSPLTEAAARRPAYRGSGRFSPGRRAPSAHSVRGEGPRGDLRRAGTHALRVRTQGRSASAEGDRGAPGGDRRGAREARKATAAAVRGSVSELRPPGGGSRSQKRPLEVPVKVGGGEPSRRSRFRNCRLS